MNNNRNRIHLLAAGIACSMLLASLPVQARETVSLQTAVRMQMRQAQDNILAEQRFALKNGARLLDNPSIKVGPLQLIESAAAEQTDSSQDSAVVTYPDGTAVTDALAEDLLAKALRAPGLMGVSRFITLTALELVSEPAK